MTLIKGSPCEAIKELIWNACDADAKNIEVTFKYEGFKGIEYISDIFVKDDGHGIPFDCVEEYFGKYGRSQKTYSDMSPGGRVYHGKLGQGRYKSLAVGNSVNWKTVFQDQNGRFLTYEIQINSGARMDVFYSEAPEESAEKQTGTCVHVNGILDDKVSGITKISESEEMIPELLLTFAPYLLAYKDITIKYNGIVVNPDKQIKKKGEKIIVFSKEGKDPITTKVIAITWKDAQFPKLYICGSSGVVYAEANYSPLKQTSTSMYLMGDLYEKLHRENTLAMGMADPAYAYFDDEAKKFVKEFIGEQESDEAAAEIGRIKEEGVYPYDGEPIDAITKAERDVFDVLAVEVNRAVPQLRTSNNQTKKLTYRLMKEAINTNPSSIKVILTEVFNLTQEQQDNLADLLMHTHLPEIIDVAKTVSDRLMFINVLENMVYNDSVGKPIKERSQFHKILIKELWVFGEKYALGTSDQSLKKLLKEHIKLLGRDELIPDIPIEAAENLNRIPDICLFRQICSNYEQYEHLVIELKRPTLVLGKNEVDQILEYAMTVAENPMFDKMTTKWHFILLGKDFDSRVVTMLKNRTQGEGNYYNSDDGSVSISILRWSTVIQNNKFRYEFLRQKLNYELSNDPNFAMDYLLARHAELFSMLPEYEEK